MIDDYDFSVYKERLKNEVDNLVPILNALDELEDKINTNLADETVEELQMDLGELQLEIMGELDHLQTTKNALDAILEESI